MPLKSKSISYILENKNLVSPGEKLDLLAQAFNPSYSELLGLWSKLRAKLGESERPYLQKQASKQASKK